MEDFVNNFESNDDLEEVEDAPIDPLQIKKEDYEISKIIKYWQETHMFHKTFTCPKCSTIMKLEKSNQYMDNYVFRCRSKQPNHDIKINIRSKSSFENIKIKLNVMHYLIFYCFIGRKSISKSYSAIKKFCEILGEPLTSTNTIIKLYQILRNLIKKYYHYQWDNSLLGIEPAEGGVSRIEIDESEIIGKNDKILWMFGLIDRANKEARVFCVMDNRRKENILPIIKNNVYTPDVNEENEDMKTRIYSDCFSVYQENDFLNMGYKLHRVNHSVWFGQGLFHTNTVEGLWATIKRLNGNFSGITFKTLENLESNGITSKDYLNDWICYSLFLRDCDKNKYDESQSREYLVKILKIN